VFECWVFALRRRRSRGGRPRRVKHNRLRTHTMMRRAGGQRLFINFLHKISTCGLPPVDPAGQ